MKIDRRDCLRAGALAGAILAMGVSKLLASMLVAMNAFDAVVPPRRNTERGRILILQPALLVGGNDVAFVVHLDERDVDRSDLFEYLPHGGHSPIAIDGGRVDDVKDEIGVRHFFELTALGSRLYGAAGYAAYLVEEHHAEKRDAPSGTAREIAAIFEKEAGSRLPVTSVRAGTVPGTHRLVFESPEDEVEIIHRARGRAGFARGAVWAAERIAGRTGVYEFGELLRETLVGT